MASETRHNRDSVEQSLIENAARYSLVEAYRVLCLIVAENGMDPLHYIRLRPVLGMGLPRSEVQSIERVMLGNGLNVYQINVNLAGLYGQQSVLPNFITEEIVRASYQDEHGGRFFLDLIHQRLYQLVYKARVANLPYASADSVTNMQQMMLSMIGLRGASWIEDFVDPAFILRNINVFRLQRRTSAGLIQLLANLFKRSTVSVEECCERAFTLPESQRCFIGRQGNELGNNGIVGSKISEYQGRIVVKISGISAEQYRQWALDERYWRSLKTMIQYFLDQPLVVELQFNILQSEGFKLVFGKHNQNQLGRSAWLLHDQASESIDARVRVL